MSIIWLASYPKSGNTWLRVFLSNYLRDDQEPADINNLERMGIASAGGLIERYAGVESSELTPDEIDNVRPAIYRLLAQDCGEARFVKVHDAYTLLPNGRPLFPPEATQGAIYIVRNPLDVALSMRHHMNDPDIDKTISRMANPNATLCGSTKRGDSQVRQKLLTWSEHVSSWLDSSKPFPVQLVSYEEMRRDPQAAFAQVVTFANLPLDTNRLERAIRFSDFECLQRQEAANGFRERTSTQSRFFRRGKVGGWRDHLSPDQTRQIVTDHGDVMRRLGYFNPTDSVAA